VGVWLQLVIAACAVALTVALVAALVALRRALERAEGVMGIAERELAPLAAEARGLMEELRALSRQASREVGRVGEVTDQLSTLVGRLAWGVAGLTRAGQLIGVAAAVKRGIDVFVHRMRAHQPREPQDGGAPEGPVRGER
jgi:hypothetical protein